MTPNQKRQLTKATNLVKRHRQAATAENLQDLQDLLRIPGMSQYLANLYLKSHPD